MTTTKVKRSWVNSKYSNTDWDVDADRWFDQVARHPQKSEPHVKEMVKISKQRPTKQNLEKFEKALGNAKVTWALSLVHFIKNMKAGKYKHQYRYMYGGGDGYIVSQTSSLFNEFYQAINYYNI